MAGDAPRSSRTSSHREPYLALTFAYFAGAMKKNKKTISHSPKSVENGDCTRLQIFTLVWHHKPFDLFLTKFGSLNPNLTSVFSYQARFLRSRV